MKIPLIILMLLISITHAQEAEKLYWKKDGLTLQNFLAQVDTTSSFHANTNAGLSFSWGLKNINGVVELRYDIQSYFNPHDSWIKSSSANEYLLKHEQLHFDITELHARKLKKHLSRIKVEDLGKNPKGILKRAYERIDKERILMQLKYDKETRHSLDKKAQAQWKVFIDAELKKLDPII